MNKKEYLVALAGSPNTGKSTLFNVLTGKRQHVGNWPGKTVERYEGIIEHHGKIIRLVDLPGTYSLSAISEEEVIAREFIVREKPDAVIVIVNSIELYQSLYLALQIMELTDNVIIAVNKIDAAIKRGVHINFRKMSSILGVPVVGISALKKQGIHMLIETLLDIIERRIRVRPYRVNYGSVEYYIREIERKLSYAECGKLAIYPRRWLAIRLLEGDSELEGLMKEECGELKNTVDEIKTRAEQEMGSSITMMLINERHKFIEELVSSCLKIEKVASPSFTEYLDSIFLSPIWGLPTTIALVSSMLILIFTVNTGFPLNILFQFMGYHHLAELVEEYSISGLFSEFFSLIADSLRIYLDDIGFPIWIRELIASGIIEGVGGVLGFFPLVFMVYIVYGLLEDSGLMARIAVVGDRIARKMGLSGKALIPLFLGLGCNVPAILGSRILEEDKEKLLVNLISPLVPCQARLFVLLAIISSLSISLTMQVALVLLTYLLVVVLIFILAYLFHIFIFTKYKAPELLIELPPYHSPSLRVVAWYAWERGEHFLRKAGTIILTLSCLLYTSPSPRD